MLIDGAPPDGVSRETLLGGGPVTDTTGAGDAFTAALIDGLGQYQDPQAAARLAAAASLTVGYPGGRPELNRDRLQERLASG